MIRIRMIWLIQVGVDVIQIDVIQNYRIFAPNFFNFKIILALRIFENSVVSRVLIFTFLFAVTQGVPVVKIRCPSIEEDKASDVTWWGSVTAVLPNTAILPDSSTTLQTGNMWRYAPDDSQWDHRNSIIHVPP